LVDDHRPGFPPRREAKGHTLLRKAWRHPVPGARVVLYADRDGSVLPYPNFGTSIEQTCPPADVSDADPVRVGGRIDPLPTAIRHPRAGSHALVVAAADRGYERRVAKN